MDRLFQDLRFAARLLSKDRGFTLTTVATLALCLAANTAIFAIVNSVLLRPLPFPEPERIAHDLQRLSRRRRRARVERRARLLRSAGATRRRSRRSRCIAPAGVTIGGQGPGGRAADQHAGHAVVLPAPRARSRTAGSCSPRRKPSRARTGRSILSYGLWQRLFGGRDDAIGRTCASTACPSR